MAISRKAKANKRRSFPAKTGPVRGAGGPVSDSIPARVKPGSYVLPADTVKSVAGMCNGGGVRKMAEGGGVKTRLSNGEHVMAPEQVNAIGQAVLDMVRQATHTPVKNVGGMANGEGIPLAEKGRQFENDPFFGLGSLVPGIADTANQGMRLGQPQTPAQIASPVASVPRYGANSVLPPNPASQYLDVPLKNLPDLGGVGNAGVTQPGRQASQPAPNPLPPTNAVKPAVPASAVTAAAMPEGPANTSIDAWEPGKRIDARIGGGLASIAAGTPQTESYQWANTPGGGRTPFKVETVPVPGGMAAGLERVRQGLLSGRAEQGVSGQGLYEPRIAAGAPVQGIAAQAAGMPRNPAQDALLSEMDRIRRKHWEFNTPWSKEEIARVGVLGNAMNPTATHQMAGEYGLAGEGVRGMADMARANLLSQAERAKAEYAAQLQMPEREQKMQDLQMSRLLASSDPKERAFAESYFAAKKGKAGDKRQVVTFQNEDINKPNIPAVLNPDNTATPIRLADQSPITSTTGSPYAEGTRLKGKDGKIYVVNKGVPVLAQP